MLLRAREDREGLRTVLRIAIPGKFMEYIVTNSQSNTTSKHVTSFYREKKTLINNNLPPSCRIGMRFNKSWP